MDLYKRQPFFEIYGPKDHAGRCAWQFTRWHQRQENHSEEFVGCVEGGAIWNANGFGVVKYNGWSDYQVTLFGDGGWDSKEVLR